MDWLREQITDWEAEQIRVSVRTGTAKAVADGTDVPGGGGSGFTHIAAPASAGGKMTKAQRKQSAKDKAAHEAGLEGQAAGAPPGGRAPKAKAKSKGQAPDTKEEACSPWCLLRMVGPWEV